MLSNEECVKAYATELEEKGAYRFFGDNEIYDMEYNIDDYFEFRSGRAMVACGGPNIYVNSKTNTIDLYWWNEEAHYPVFPDCMDEVNEYFAEMFEMAKCANLH